MRLLAVGRGIPLAHHNDRTSQYWCRSRGLASLAQGALPLDPWWTWVEKGNKTGTYHMCTRGRRVIYSLFLKTGTWWRKRRIKWHPAATNWKVYSKVNATIHTFILPGEVHTALILEGRWSGAAMSPHQEAALVESLLCHKSNGLRIVNSSLWAFLSSSVESLCQAEFSCRRQNLRGLQHL
jgi:hypothetical protein